MAWKRKEKSRKGFKNLWGFRCVNKDNRRNISIFKKGKREPKISKPQR